MNTSTTYSPGGNSAGMDLSIPEPWAFSARWDDPGLTPHLLIVLIGYAVAPSILYAELCPPKWNTISEPEGTVSVRSLLGTRTLNVSAHMLELPEDQQYEPSVPF